MAILQLGGKTIIEDAPLPNLLEFPKMEILKMFFPNYVCFGHSFSIVYEDDLQINWIGWTFDIYTRLLIELTELWVDFCV